MENTNFNKIAENDSHREGPLAKAIEKQTAKLPSDTFLWAALGSIGISATLRAFGAKHMSLFVGQWAPTFLMLGVYNKIVKVAGSDQQDRGADTQHEGTSNTGGIRHSGSKSFAA